MPASPVSLLAQGITPLRCAAEQYNVINQYAIKLPDTSPFLSMPSRKNWILHGQSNDSFGFKYWLGFNVSRGTGEYTPATQHAEVSGLSAGFRV